MITMSEKLLAAVVSVQMSMLRNQSIADGKKPVTVPENPAESFLLICRAW